MAGTSVPPDVRKEIGIADGLIRLSVGIEDVGDLQRDCSTQWRRRWNW